MDEALLGEMTEDNECVDQTILPGPANSVIQSLVGSCLFIADSGHNRIVVSSTLKVKCCTSSVRENRV